MRIHAGSMGQRAKESVYETETKYGTGSNVTICSTAIKGSLIPMRHSAKHSWGCFSQGGLKPVSGPNHLIKTGSVL